MDRQLLQWIAEVFGPDSPAHEDLASAVVSSDDRISKAYAQLLDGYSRNPFDELTPVVEVDPQERHGVVLVRDIHFVSMCSHHFLPFFGVADVAYEPRTTIVGLGKIPRVVNTLARRFQLQELLTRSIVETLMQGANAAGAWAHLKAQHLCISHRGPSSPDASTDTIFSVGALKGWWPPQAGAIAVDDQTRR